jgi:hypothetical protein
VSANHSDPTQPAVLHHTTASKKTGANNVRSYVLSKEQRHEYKLAAQGMRNEELALFVAETNGNVLRKLAELQPYLEELWSRFSRLDKSQSIYGCRTKAEFCEKCLHRNIRAVQYMLYGRPAKESEQGQANIVRSPAPRARDGKCTFQLSWVVTEEEYKELNDGVIRLGGEEAVKQLILAQGAKKGAVNEKPKMHSLAAQA